MSYIPSNLAHCFAKKILQDLRAEFRKTRRQECHLGQRKWTPANRKVFTTGRKEICLAAPNGASGFGAEVWDGRKKVCLSEGSHHCSAHLPCNTHISHRRSLLETQGRCMAEDADCARILPPPPSAAGWPSPCPSHSYVLQTGLSSNKRSTGICPFNQNGFGD